MTLIDLQEKHYESIVCLLLNVFNKYTIFCKKLDDGLVGINQPHTTEIIQPYGDMCLLRFSLPDSDLLISKVANINLQ